MNPEFHAESNEAAEFRLTKVTLVDSISIFAVHIRESVCACVFTRNVNETREKKTSFVSLAHTQAHKKSPDMKN